MNPGKVRQEFFEKIIRNGEDINNQYWMKVSCSIKDCINHEGFEINMLSPKACVGKALENFKSSNKGDLTRCLDDIENAYYCLMMYAVNLSRGKIKHDPSSKKRQEFYLIKTYTGYYKCNIESVMNGHDKMILQSIGYVQDRSSENGDELILHHISEHLDSLAYQLYLAQVYCQRIKCIIYDILHEYPVKVAVKIFEYIDKPEFKLEEVPSYCCLIDKGMQRNMEDFSQSNKERHTWDNHYIRQLQNHYSSPPYKYGNDDKKTQEQFYSQQVQKQQENQLPENQYTSPTSRSTLGKFEDDDNDGDDMYGNVTVTHQSSVPNNCVPFNDDRPPPTYEEVQMSQKDQTCGAQFSGHDVKNREGIKLPPSLKKEQHVSPPVEQRISNDQRNVRIQASCGLTTTDLSSYSQACPTTELFSGRKLQNDYHDLPSIYSRDEDDEK